MIELVLKPCQFWKLGLAVLSVLLLSQPTKAAELLSIPTSKGAKIDQDSTFEKTKLDAKEILLHDQVDLNSTHSLTDGVGGMSQVTSVSQLTNVKPTDWAFQALQSLVERYIRCLWHTQSVLEIGSFVTLKFLRHSLYGKQPLWESES